MQRVQKPAFSFLKKRGKFIFGAKRTTLPTKRSRCALYATADFIFYCWVTLKKCYRNWTHFTSNINTWTVSIHNLSVKKVELLLSGVVKYLIMCKKQSVLFNEAEEWTECPAKKILLAKKYRKHSMSSFKRTNQRKAADQSLQEDLNKLRREKELGNIQNCRLFPVS